MNEVETIVEQARLRNAQAVELVHLGMKEPPQNLCKSSDNFELHSISIGA